MSEINHTDELVTKSELSEFYQGIYPYLNGATHAGFTPVGTIISVMGKTAPANYLACQGQTVNIADYPELAAYFKEQFGSNNHFGGDGTTTFKIPDLRGEFLRGTGTNSHNQGNGASVGEHQDGTGHVAIGYSYEANKDYLSFPHAGESTWVGYRLADKTFSSGGTNAFIISQYTNTNERVDYYTSRPTNTSVLYCIATKNIYVDARYDYSTDEKVVGTWIDGKPIYQKTYLNMGNLPDSDSKQFSFNVNDVDTIVNVDVSGVNPETSSIIPLPCVHPTVVAHSVLMQVTRNDGSPYLFIRCGDSNWATHFVRATIRYTKTSG